MATIFLPENPNAQGTNEADSIIGTWGDDRILGLGGNDEVYAQAGNDNLFGNAGNDIIFGGNGADSVYGGRDDDQLWGDDDPQKTGGNDFLYGNQGSDNLFGGIGDDQLFGGQGNDFLVGDDRLVAGVGTDYLSGDLGFDLLTGDRPNRGMQGARDIFVLRPSLDNSFDYITDFKPTEDEIHVGVGLTLNDLQISTITEAGLSGATLSANFSLTAARIGNQNNLADGFIRGEDIVIRVKSSGQILGVLSAYPTLDNTRIAPNALTADNIRFL